MRKGLKAKREFLVSSRKATNRNQGDGQPRRKVRSSHRIKVAMKFDIRGQRLGKGCQDKNQSSLAEVE